MLLFLWHLFIGACRYKTLVVGSRKTTIHPASSAFVAMGYLAREARSQGVNYVLPTASARFAAKLKCCDVTPSNRVP